MSELVAVRVQQQYFKKLNSTIFSKEPKEFSLGA
jgi:hypothetical protein